MKVLFLARGCPDPKNSTLGIFEYDMAKAVAKAGHDVVYMAMDHRSLRHRRPWGIHVKEQEGLTIVSVNLPLGRLYYPLRLFLGEKAMMRAYRKLLPQMGKPDVLHAHFAGMAILGARLKKATGIPLVITEHSSKLNRSMEPFYMRRLKEAYGTADVLTAVSKALAARMHQLFGMAAEVVPNVLDTETFQGMGKKAGKAPFAFVSAGNLIPVKGMEELLHAFRQVHGNKPETTLTIYGRGPLKAKLQGIVQKWGLGDAVRLEGLVSRSALHAAYDRASCFVLASHSETFGVAYVEALASGLPVIATRSGGPQDYVDSTNGLLVPPKDQEALAEAMLWMTDHAHDFDGAGIAQRMKARFGPDNVAAVLEDVYERAVERAGDGT